MKKVDHSGRLSKWCIELGEYDITYEPRKAQALADFRSIKTISSQKKSAMMKLGVENDIALLNYLSSVSMTPLDKD